MARHIGVMVARPLGITRERQGGRGGGVRRRRWARATELEVEAGAHAVQHEDIIEFMVARWPDTLA